MLFSRRKWSLLSCEDASSIQFVPSRLLRLEVRHLYYMDIGICCFAEAVLYCCVIEVWNGRKPVSGFFAFLLDFSVWFQVRLCLPELLQAMLLEVRLCTRNLLEEKKISGRSRLPIPLASGRAGGPSTVLSTGASRWALHPDSQSVWPVMQSVPRTPVPCRRDKEHRQLSCCSRFQRSCSPQSARAGKILPYAVLVLNSQQFKQRQRSERSTWL